MVIFRWVQAQSCCMMIWATTFISVSYRPSFSSSFSSSWSSNKPRLAPAPFDPHMIRTFVRNRCNGGGIPYIRLNQKDLWRKRPLKKNPPDVKGCAMWIYEGALVDPSNGRTIAQVQGLELVRHLTECYNTPSSTESPSSSPALQSLCGWRKIRGINRLGDLAIKQILTDPANQSQWDYATTVLSRKLFCYGAPLAEVQDDLSPSNHHLLSSFRLRPTSPIRKIPIQQSTALYDVATTFISCNRGRNLYIHTEFPDGRWCLGSASSPSSVTAATSWTPNNFDFQVYVRANSSKEKIPSFIFHSKHDNIHTTSSSSYQSNNKSSKWKLPRRRKKISSYSSSTAASTPLIISPPRSKLFQWGKDSFMDQLRKYGSSRETYSYSMEYPQQFIKNNDNNSSPTNIHNILEHVRLSLSSFTYNCVHHRIIQPIQILGDRIGLWDHYDNMLMDDSLSQQKYYKTSFPSSSYSDDLPPLATKCSVRYTRFGESPPWYGIGRMCTLELMGQKISSTFDVPPLVARIAATQIPGFMSVYTSIPTEPIVTIMIPPKEGHHQSNIHGEEKLCPQYADQQIEADQDAISAISWFRGKVDGSIPLQII